MINEFLLELNEINKSDSNLDARELKLSETETDNVLKQKKIKQKKHNAKRISSLKTINSIKQSTENKNKKPIKTMSNIIKI